MSSGIRGIVKDGWHPKGKEGGKESWRGDFKGINQVAGWVGKGKSGGGGGGASDQSERVSRPLTSLKDPSTFGPPPTRVNYNRGVAPPPARTGSENRGSERIGSPLTPSQLQQQEEEEAEARWAEEQEQEQRSRPPPPPVPYRVDTTGLSTNNLPKPPSRHNDYSPSEDLPPTTSRKPKPSLPPRLPPRRNTNLEQPSSPPPAYKASHTAVPAVNQGAINRLGKSGVSVPSLGINRTSSREGAPERSVDSPQNELQARFAKMKTSSGSPASPAAQSPAEGTTFEQKQNALRTARSFHRDPTSVSPSEARSAASTARSFRERHSDQIESGKKKLTGLDQKYGISKRFNSFIEDQKSPAYPEQAPQQQPQPPVPPHPSSGQVSPSYRPDMETLNRRKPPPPPPPPKKREMQAPPVNQSDSPPPPPLPLGTKPR